MSRVSGRTTNEAVTFSKKISGLVFPANPGRNWSSPIPLLVFTSANLTGPSWTIRSISRTYSSQTSDRGSAAVESRNVSLIRGVFPHPFTKLEARSGSLTILTGAGIPNSYDPSSGSIKSTGGTGDSPTGASPVSRTMFLLPSLTKVRDWFNMFLKNDNGRMEFSVLSLTTLYKSHKLPVKLNSVRDR